jgi:hypothetical protein
LGVAFHAAGDQVAIRIALAAGARAFFFGGGPPCDAGQPRGGNLVGQAHFHHMPRFAALDHAQSVLGDEAADRLAHRTCGETDIASHAHKRKLEAEFSFQAAVAQEMRIDGALDDGQAQARRELVFQLFPDKFSVSVFWLS